MRCLNAIDVFFEARSLGNVATTLGQQGDDLLIEAVDAVVSVWGADRVGLHLSPRGDATDLADSDPKALYTHVARERLKALHAQHHPRG